MANKITNKLNLVRVVTALFCCLPALAFAHHPMDGVMPETFSQGFLSGIGHPIIGLDHLAFVIAAGVLAWKLGKPLVLLSGFVLATAVGSLVVSYGASISLLEPLILLSLALVGVSLIKQKQVGVKLAMAFYPIAGFMHGSAYGEAIIGAEATPIVAYLMGFACIQFAIAYAAAQSIKVLSKCPEQTLQYARITGAVVVGIATTYAFEMAESAVFVVA